MLTDCINDCLLWQSQRASAVFKQEFSDFIVEEQLNWTFKGEGEHLFLFIEKTNCNTVWIAKQLARFYHVPPRDIGYSGLKDRHAVTRQYFSVRLPGVKPDSYDLPEHDEYRVLSHTLHDKKLKRGNHSHNDFTIRLREVRGDKQGIEARLRFIRENGCPNLFDNQRFGHDNNNLSRFEAWASGHLDVRKRNEKSLLLSAFRSALFNRQLATRVADGTWQQIIAGDTVMLAGSNSYFVADSLTAELQQRASDKDIHPAGCLVGEQDVLEDMGSVDSTAVRELLRRERLTTGYRPLRLIVENLHWHFEEPSNCIISMRLPTGAYASGVVKQIFDI